MQHRVVLQNSESVAIVRVGEMGQWFQGTGWVGRCWKAMFVVDAVVLWDDGGHT